jgi:CubicO group peptidase (beta-lactamase class C family)
MQQFIRYACLAVFISGCYATTDKYILPKKPADTASWSIPETGTVSAEEYRKVYAASSSFYESILSPTHFQGAMLVAKKGQVIFEKYDGIESHRSKEQIDSNSAFHLASVSKTFTGMAVVKLWEDGKLQLGDEASVYLQGFPFKGVTIRSLLNHRSGLPNYVHFMEQLGWDRKKQVTNADVLQWMIQHKNRLAVARPDTRFNYSNTNYALLALIIEKVSGTTYANYLKQTFFDPLGMTHSFVFSMDMVDRVVPSYNWKNQQEAFTFLDAVVGDKNVYSTPRDLLKWDIALSYGNLFKPSSLDSAYAGYSYEKKGIKNYGLGWRLYEFPTGKKVVYHNGWWHGNNTVFSRLTQDSATIIVLGNRYNRRIYDAKKIYAAFDGYGMEAQGDE